MKLQSLADLEQLLTESEKKKYRKETSEVKKTHSGKGNSVRVTLDTAGRKGKSVTVISGLQHNPSTMEEIARILKQHCGAGGTVKNATIEIQGDQRENVKRKLHELDYIIK